MKGREAGSRGALAAALLCLLSLAGAVYSYYYLPEIRFAEQHSYLTTVDLADTIVINASNVTLDQLPMTVTVSPSGGFLSNATLSIALDDPDSLYNGTVKVYSTLPLQKTGDLWLLPMTQDPVELDVFVDFQNPPVNASVPITFTVYSAGLSEPVNTTVYIEGGEENWMSA